jgi:radical SAM protein with 4Fe4S-binding SPASM domain
MFQRADLLNFLSKLTLKKGWNALKIFTSFWVSKIYSKPTLWGMPITISIEPTTNCNLGCPECPSGLKSFSRPTGNLEIQEFKKIIDETYSTSIYVYFYFQGEPFMHPKFLDLVRYATSKKLYTVTSTNAHFLSERKATETVESGLDRIIISVDGTTQEVYEKYRRDGNLSKVIQGIKNLVAAKQKLQSKTPHIILQFLVVQHNEHQIEEVKKLAKELTVNELKLKTAQIYDFENGNHLIPQNQKYSRYKKLSNGKFAIKSELQNYCWKLWHSAEITWDGKVVPCCFDKDAKYLMGNAFTTNFKNVWQSKNYVDFRTRLLNGRKEIDICTNCSEGLKVWE